MRRIVSKTDLERAFAEQQAKVIKTWFSGSVLVVDVELRDRNWEPRDPEERRRRLVKLLEELGPIGLRFVVRLSSEDELW